MKLVITGASGFLGQAFIRSVQSGMVPGYAGAQLVLLTHDARRIPELVARYPGAEVYTLRDDIGRVQVEPMRNADVLLHLGWSTVPATAALDPEMDHRTNVEGGMELLHAAGEAHVRRFIFLSSGGTVYGRATELPIREDHPLLPLETYGASKLAFEEMLGAWCSNTGMDYLILRPGNVYGSTTGPNKPQGVVDHWLASVRRNAPVEVWHGLDVVRDLVHVEDMMEVMHRAVRYAGMEHVLNVGTGRGTSLAELQTLIAKVTGRKLQVVDRQEGTAAVMANVLDNTRMRKALGDVRFRTVEEGLAAVWRAMNA
ncbi:MAG: NAD-dependent epimerase/dehydratase family protein [Flavobacteriales bacterium]|nr:NAD-dependent epimerase/dehydratase family protein [Flavobacteriales bacterium]